MQSCLTVDSLIGTMCPNPKMNILKSEIQPNFPENCPISAFFRTIKTPVNNFESVKLAIILGVTATSTIKKYDVNQWVKRSCLLYYIIVLLEIYCKGIY